MRRSVARSDSTINRSWNSASRQGSHCAEISLPVNGTSLNSNDQLGRLPRRETACSSSSPRTLVVLRSGGLGTCRERLLVDPSDDETRGDTVHGQRRERRREVLSETGHPGLRRGVRVETGQRRGRPSACERDDRPATLVQRRQAMVDREVVPSTLISSVRRKLVWGVLADGPRSATAPRRRTRVR